jgi:hypothetical protein
MQASQLATASGYRLDLESYLGQSQTVCPNHYPYQHRAASDMWPAFQQHGPLQKCTLLGEGFSTQVTAQTPPSCVGQIEALA